MTNICVSKIIYKVKGYIHDYKIYNNTIFITLCINKMCILIFDIYNQRL